MLGWVLQQPGETSEGLLFRQMMRSIKADFSAAAGGETVDLL